jgi:putative PIG3 family NAD(P)H quinone oxidoreductase
MLAIEIAEFGGPDVLVPVERPVPVPGDGEVRIKVAAAGVNRPDVLQRMGRYPPPPGASDLPGLEVSGVIDAVAPGVSDFSVGDEVCALLAGGGYAEYCIAPAPQCLPLPSGVALVDAAGIPETAFTVWTNLFERGRLTSGETALIHGGSSGIGTTAIQIARARGAHVFATAGSAEKCAACERLGAERAFNYQSEDFVTRVKEVTAGRGVDVILDMVGGDYLQRNIDALATNGRLVMIGRQRGEASQLDIMPILRKRLTLTGSTLRTRTVGEKGELAKAVEANVWPLFESGAVHVEIFQRFPLRDAAGAHRLMQSSHHIGKLLLIA